MAPCAENPCQNSLCCRAERRSIDPCEVITECLQHTAFALGFLLQLIKMLGEQIADRVRWLELQGQHAFGREDSKQHLHPMFELLYPAESLIHPGPHPRRNRLALLLIPLTLCGQASHLLLRDALHPPDYQEQVRA